MINQAIILAAGLGTRMRPLTNKTPKPLININGKALIDYKLDAVRRAGITKIVVNAHHLFDQMHNHLRSISDLDIIISDERGQLMDSGGGIKKALTHLSPDPFLVLNSDTFWHGDTPSNLTHLIDNWNADEMDFLLGLTTFKKAVGFDGAGDFFSNEQGQLKRRGKQTAAPLIFSGDYITQPRLFKNTPEGPFSVLSLFDEAIEANRLHGVEHNGIWLHVGTPEAIMAVERAIAQYSN